MKIKYTFYACSVLMLMFVFSNNKAEASVLNHELNLSSQPSDTLEPLPVELERFVATTIKNEVILDWYTGHEHNNSGFEVERAQIINSIESLRDANYTKVGYMQGAGNTTLESVYKFKDLNVPTGKFAYRLKQIDFNGNFRYFVLSNEVIVNVPVKFSLLQNYPNPFNPVTHIKYEISADSKVSLKIFDITGRDVKDVVTGFQPAGYYDLNVDASTLSSGVYYFRLSAQYSNGSFEKTLKMMIVK